VPVVAFLLKDGGSSLFGLRLVDSTHHVEVHFLADPGCAPLLESDESWPTPHPECTGPAGLSGKVGTLGTTMSGRSLVGVQFTVPATNSWRPRWRGPPVSPSAPRRPDAPRPRTVPGSQALVTRRRGRRP
jgi:hypothetical protein